MDVEHTRSFAFLFSLAALPMAGCPAGDDTESATNADSSSTSNDPTTSTSNSTTATTTATTTSADTTISTTEEPTTESGTTTTDTESTSTGTDSSSGSESSSSGEAPESSSGSTGAEVDPLCQAYADKIVECYPKYAAYADYLATECTYQLGYYAGYSAACGMAFEEALSCIGSADCKELAAETACTEEQSAVAMACPDGKESTTSVGTSAGEDAGEGGAVSDGG